MKPLTTTDTLTAIRESAARFVPDSQLQQSHPPAVPAVSIVIEGERVTDLRIAPAVICAMADLALAVSEVHHQLAYNERFMSLSHIADAFDGLTKALAINQASAPLRWTTQ
jgi:hypothetical protein